jgi:hypothetical protein
MKSKIHRRCGYDIDADETTAFLARMSKRSIFLGSSVLLAALMLSGCASEKVKAELKKQRENKDGYVWVTPTGSNIPVLVPKDQVKTDDKTTDQSQQAMADVQRANNRAPATSGSK